MKKFFPSLLLLSAFLFVWEAASKLGNISKTILPAPSDIFAAIITYRDILVVHTIQTLEETLIGLLLATALGVGIAIPLFLIWFGFDLLPKVIVVVLYCFFPIAIAVTDALHAVDQNSVNLLKSMRASNWQILYSVRLPSALPAFFSGLRISATYAITGAIVGEYVGAYKGLGVFMQTSANSHITVLVFAALAIVALLSIALLAFVSILERMYTPWKN